MNNLERLFEQIGRHASMCADYERMGTGEFVRKYPDYKPDSGFHYVARSAKMLIADAYRASQAAQGIEARQRQDAKRLDPKDESPVSEGNAP